MWQTCKTHWKHTNAQTIIKWENEGKHHLMRNWLQQTNENASSSLVDLSICRFTIWWASRFQLLFMMMRVRVDHDDGAGGGHLRQHHDDRVFFGLWCCVYLCMYTHTHTLTLYKHAYTYKEWKLERKKVRERDNERGNKTGDNVFERYRSTRVDDCRWIRIYSNQWLRLGFTAMYFDLYDTNSMWQLAVPI